MKACAAGLPEQNGCFVINHCINSWWRFLRCKLYLAVTERMIGVCQDSLTILPVMCSGTRANMSVRGPDRSSSR